MPMDFKIASTLLPAQDLNLLGRLARIQLRFAVGAMVGFCSFGFASTGLAQSAPPNAQRQPAPYRPSFDNANRQAAPLNRTAENRGESANVKSILGGPVLPPGSPAAANSDPNNGNQDNGRGLGGRGLGQPVGTQTSQPSRPDVEPGITRVTKTLSTLPNSAGQVWREYDISPYTSQIKTTENPQKSITEWVLRETGVEMWFHQPLGILNADRDRLLVYHTPEIQNIVKGIVDRFNRTRGQIQNIDVNLVTVQNPKWRSQLYTMLQPIEVKSPGIEAWMVSKENAAILISQLRRRSDFKQHSGGRLSNHDGQSFVLEKTRPVQFVRSLRWVPNQIPNHQPVMTQVDEGYRLEISCLSALDNSTIEAVIKCDVDQVERLSNVNVNVPGIGGNQQQLKLQIPQLVSWRLHERFRWPNDQVLVLSCGVVATPEPETNGSGYQIPILPKKSQRADALLFVEYRGPADGATIPQTATRLAPIRTPR